MQASVHTINNLLLHRTGSLLIPSLGYLQGDIEYDQMDPVAHFQQENDQNPPKKGVGICVGHDYVLIGLCLLQDLCPN